MSAQYLTIQNDRLDQICRRYFGTEGSGNVEAVLDVNRGLAALGPIYPSGVLIFLPDRPTATIPEAQVVHLWS